MGKMQQQLRQSSVVVVVVVLLLSLLATGCTGTDPLAGPVFHSRRVSKSTASVEPQQLLLSPSPIVSASREHLKGRSLGGAQGPRTTTVAAAAIRQRFEQTVQQVKSRTKELRMEQEQKRVDRKLRRDQQKQERAAVAAATATSKPAAKSQTLKLTFEPVNPHNLQMPDCGTEGKVYNGRRCVLMSKMSKKPKH